MTNSIGEIEFNDVLFIIGSNATTAHPIIGNKMKKAALRGAKLIVADPRRTELAEYAHLWLRLKPGTDNALVNGLLNLIITNGWHDQAYIDKRCEGYDDLWKVVKDYPPRGSARSPACRSTSCAPRPSSMRPRREPASTTRSASPSTPPARPT